MSDNKAEQPGANGAGAGIDKAIDGAQPTGASPEQQMQGPVKDAMNVESPKLAPGDAGGESVKAESAAPADAAPASKADAGIDAKAEVRPDAKPQSSAAPAPGKVMIMSPQDRGWRDDRIDQDPAFRDKAASKPPRETRVAAFAAVAILALFAGAAGGALATVAFGGSASNAATTTPAAEVAAEKTLREQAITRLESDLASLKASVEHTGKTSSAQVAKVNDRLDRVEKAQAEPNAKIAKLSEAVDKLRTAPAAVAAAPAQAAANPPRETTGSVQANAATGQPVAPKPEVARLPTVEGWVLRDVADGGALIENRRGTYEVYAGDEIRGLGRVDAIRKQDGRWVVVTSRGLIVSR